jgi:hypothetical protein
LYFFTLFLFVYFVTIWMSAFLLHLIHKIIFLFFVLSLTSGHGHGHRGKWIWEHYTGVWSQNLYLLSSQLLHQLISFIQCFWERVSTVRERKKLPLFFPTSSFYILRRLGFLSDGFFPSRGFPNFILCYARRKGTLCISMPILSHCRGHTHVCLLYFYRRRG